MPIYLINRDLFRGRELENVAAFNIIDFMYKRLTFKFYSQNYGSEIFLVYEKFFLV